MNQVGVIDDLLVLPLLLNVLVKFAVAGLRGDARDRSVISVQ
jgi:hypothetical protein